MRSSILITTALLASAVFGVRPVLRCWGCPAGAAAASTCSANGCAKEALQSLQVASRALEAQPLPDKARLRYN